MTSSISRSSAPQFNTTWALVAALAALTLTITFIAIHRFRRYKVHQDLLRPLNSRVTPEMVKELKVNIVCNEVTPCSHRCIIQLKDGRQKNSQLNGPDMITLIHAVAGKVRFYCSIGGNTPVDYPDNYTTTHFDRFENFKDLFGTPWPYQTADKILTTIFK
jgi:hypothetical protein